MLAAALEGWDVVWFVLSLVGQGAFTLRFLVQWIVSERAKKVVIPVLFWWLSVFGSIILLLYSAHVGKLPFIILFAVNLGIYLRNITLLRARSRGAPLRLVIPLLLGVLFAAVVGSSAKLDFEEPIAWLVVGFAGQIVWNSRFIIQWVASEHRGRSVMPEAFWWVSLLGDALLLSYAIHLFDPHFVGGEFRYELDKLAYVLAFLFNPIMYVRNLVIMYRRKRERDARRAAEVAARESAGDDRLR